MKQVIVKVENGIVDPVNIPNGIELVIHDYDMIDTIDNELIQTDENGKDFIEIVFEETDCIK